MADIGSLLLPDIDLMKGYEQSFARQQALKSYIYQDSEKKKAEFAKDYQLTLDDGLGVVEGQQQAMIDASREYIKDYQTALQDHSKGGMWGLDPATQAKFAARKFKLEADQSQRVHAIKKLSSAQPIINKPGFGLTHDQEYTNNWVKQLKEGKIPGGEPIQALPPDLNKITTDVLKPFSKSDSSQDTVLSAGRGGSKVLTYKFNSVLAGGQTIDPKTYPQRAYDKGAQELMNNPVWRYAAEQHYQRDSEKNPAIAKQFEQFGDNAGIMYGLSKQTDLIKNITGLKTDIKAKTYKPDKPEKETEAEKKRHPQADQYGTVHLSDHKITAYIPVKDPKTGKDLPTENDVTVVSHNIKNNTFVVREPVKKKDKDGLMETTYVENTVSDPKKVAKIKSDIANSGIVLPGYKIDNTTKVQKKGAGKKLY